MQPLVAGSALSGLAVAARAWSGEPPPVDLRWEAPGGSDCPDQRRVLEEIGRLVGEAPPSSGRVTARAEVSRTAEGRFQVRLTTEVGGVEGQRSIEEDSCWAVADAAIIILALTVNPDAKLPPAPLTSTSAAAPSRSAPPVASAAPSIQRPELPVRHAYSVSVGATGDVGLMPHPSIGVEAQVRGRLGPVRVGVYGAYFPERTATVGTGDLGPVGGYFSLVAAGLEGCFAPLEREPITLELCAGPELDWMQGRGFGVTSPGEGSKAWLSLSAGASVSVPLTQRVYALGGLGLVVTDRHHPFVLAGIAPTVYQTGVLAGRGLLGLGLTFF